MFKLPGILFFLKLYARAWTFTKFICIWIASIGYFGLEFQKTNVVFEISILEFVNTQSFI